MGIIIFMSLVDKNSEARNVKMTRGVALQAFQEFEVSQSEYEEATEILKAKHGVQRRQLQTYMDQAETR